jgi:serine phosphatase RsbU (regulator of sigma subunit)
VFDSLLPKKVSSRFRWGLRVKSVLVLCLSSAMVLALSLLIGWWVLLAVEENLGSSFAKNAARFNEQRILTPILRELALSRRFADSVVTRRWLLDENDLAKKALFFDEAEGYRKAFSDHSYFIASAQSHAYYYNDARSPVSHKPSYYVHVNDPNDSWFFASLKSDEPYNINIDNDVKLHRTKVWFNVPCKDGNRSIGIAGSGLDLTGFLQKFVKASDPGVTAMFLDASGGIMAHPDPRLIDYRNIVDQRPKRSAIYGLLKPSNEAAAKSALRQASESEESLRTFWATMNGRDQLFAVAYIPEIRWYSVVAVDLRTAHLFNERLLAVPILGVLTLLVTLLVAILLGVNRILLVPLLRLTDSARAMAEGDYAIDLPQAGRDELGELTVAFGTMAEQVRTHTDTLEEKVRRRTAELTETNERLSLANQNISDSIEYASFIQNSILAHPLDSQFFSDNNYYVIWRPRDVVGGDYYALRRTKAGRFIGVVDCAGHGVPGAFMTMIAHTVINQILDEMDPSDPAALLASMDERIRMMLNAEQYVQDAPTRMDAGFAFLDFKRRTLAYSGANISLFYGDGERVHELKGGRHPLGERRKPDFKNEIVTLDPRLSFCITTDGLLDQAGGSKGFSFGRSRFTATLERSMNRSLSEQKDALLEDLSAYQGNHPQRDDITVIGFRFPTEEFE